MLTLKPLALFILIAASMLLGAACFWYGARRGFQSMIAGLPVEE